MADAKYRVYALDHFDMESHWIPIGDADDEEDAREIGIRLLIGFVRDTLDAGHEKTAEDVHKNWLCHGETVRVWADDGSPCRELDNDSYVYAIAKSMIAVRERAKA